MKLGVLVYLEHENKVLMIHRQKEDEHKGLRPEGKSKKTKPLTKPPSVNTRKKPV